MYKKENKIIDVQPIRSKEQLEDMKWSLKKWCGERDYILFLLGINTGLRCGDMLKLKKKELKRKKEVFLIEGKTGKKRKILLSNIYEELNQYIDTLESEWLFPSPRKVDRFPNRGKIKNRKSHRDDHQRRRPDCISGHAGHVRRAVD